MHLFPRMWNYAASKESYKSWSAYRTRTDYERDENGEIVRDAQGRPNKIEVLDFGRRTLWDDGSGYEPLVIVEPTFRENLNYFFTYQLNHMYWRYFLWNFVGRRATSSLPTRSSPTQLALWHQVDRRALPRTAGQPAGRNSE